MSIKNVVAKMALVVAVVGFAGCSKQEADKSAMDAVKNATSNMADAAVGATGDAADAAKAAAEKATDAVADAASGAVEAVKGNMDELLGKATEALKDVAGGSDMLAKVKDLFGTASTTLSGITDEATANAAVPEITKLTESFGGLSEAFSGLPDAAKSAVGNIFSSALGDLKPVVEKVLAIPGVDKIIKPAVDALMEKLGGFKA